MGITERKERQKQEMRENILQAAWQLVLDEGWQSLSIRKIADAIEYSVPVVYDYFENKEAIIFEINQKGFALLNEKLATAKSRHESPEAQIEAITYAYWDFAFENKAYYQLMYGLGMPTCERAKSELGIIKMNELIHSTVEAIMKAAGNTADPFPKVFSYHSTLHGLVSSNVLSTNDTIENYQAADLYRIVLKDFIKGFIVGLKG